MSRDTLFQRFSSVGEYMDTVTAPIPNDTLGRASQRGADSWSGGTSFDETVYLAEHGWMEGVEQVEKFTNRLNTTLSGLISLPELKYGVEGEFPDISLAMTGNPEFMVSIVDSSIKVDANPAKIIRIVVDTRVSAAVSTTAMILRGAAIAALTTMLERHRFRVEVEIASCISSGGRQLETLVTLKRPEESMHLPNLVFHLAHPAAFRKLMFSSWEHLDNVDRRQFGISEYGGYGMGGSPTDEGDICLHGRHTGVGDSDAATLAWITAQLEAQGIEVSHD